MLDTAYLTLNSDKEKDLCPIHPDTARLLVDLKENTNAKRVAGDALPVIHGTSHISKVGYTIAPNITIWNYIIQVRFHCNYKKFVKLFLLVCNILSIIVTFVHSLLYQGKV